MEGLGELTFHDYGDECEASAIEISNKDWCRPLQASMSRLAQMQPSVCSMYLQDAGSLKPPKSMTKLSRQRQQQESAKQGIISTGGHFLQKEGEVLENLESGQNSVRSLSATSAWGSNSSIPDLLARQKFQTNGRPSSASRFPPRNRPESAGRSKRPQSAKDFLSDKKEEGPSSLGIKGAKKPVDERPPLLPRCNSDSGMSSSRAKDAEVSSCTDSARRNSPSPVSRQTGNHRQFSVNHLTDEENTVDAETNSDKCGEPFENTVNSAEKLCVRASQDEEKPVTPPMPELIRFSLPNVNDDCDDDNDVKDEDELDTDRLLQQAESIMQKKSREDQRVLHNLTDANATIPNGSESHLTKSGGLEDFETERCYTPDCPISSVAAFNNSNRFSQCSTSHSNAQNTNNSSSNSSYTQGLRSPHVTWSESHSIRLFQADAPSPAEEDRAYRKRPGTSRPALTGKCAENKIREKNKLEENSEAETFKNHTRNVNGHDANTFIMPHEQPVSYKPLEVTKASNGQKHLNYKTRPNSGEKELVRKIVDKDEVKANCVSNSPASQPPLVSCLSQKSVLNHQSFTPADQEPARKLVPTVTLAYDDDDDNDEKTDEQVQTDKCAAAKKKSRKKKSFDEIETYMSRLDKEEEEANQLKRQSSLNHKCVCGDVSCSELSASNANDQPGTLERPRSSAGRPNSSLLGAEKTPVVKTTKTIEFCEGAAPAETVTKNLLVAVREGKPERPESHQLQSSTPSALRPSMIKRQQASEDKVKPKATEVKKSTLVLAEAKKTNNMKNSHVDTRANSNTASDQSEGGLAPPQSSSLLDTEKGREGKSDKDLYESLLEEAKAMALSSMVQAARQPAPGKKKAIVKPKPSGTPEVLSASVIKSRPFSAPLKISSAKQSARATVTARTPASANSDKHKYCQGHMSKTPFQTGMRRAQSARPARLFTRLETLRNQDDDSPEMLHAQRMQMKMAAMGVEVDAKTLERALFPPSGKSVYYNVPGDLPRNPTETLIPHYKHWLAEDYHRVKLMERRLARDDEIKHMQKVAAEKKALLAKKKGKKKRKEKCITSAG